MLQSVTEITSLLMMLKEDAAKIENMVKYTVKCLEELKDDSRKDFGKTKDTAQKPQQEKSILKRARKERDDGDPLVDDTRHKQKRARVTWKR